MRNSLLVIEDENLLGNELCRHYRKLGWELEWAKNLQEARDLLINQRLEPLVVLSDMNLPDGNALDLLEEVSVQGGPSEWIFLTGYGSVPDSVRALRLGAYDFLEKPCTLEHLDLVTTGAARSASAQRRVNDQTKQWHRRYSPEAYVGRSASAQVTRELIRKLADVPFSALIIGGETGTGKGLIARILHYSGKRAQNPLVELNCASLPKELLESQLFGHEAGAFTGAKGLHRGLMEQADGGTLFLDEIGELHADLQAKVLKAIEERRIRRLGSEKELAVDVQIISASHRDLEKMVSEGEFRGDLYHRLNVFRVNLPALRDVKEDLHDLLPLFLAEFNAKAGKKVQIVPDEIWAKLKDHHWPGNVRELRNAVERCVLFSDGPVLPVQWLQLSGLRELAQNTDDSSHGESVILPLDGSMALDDMDKHIIETTLHRLNNNIAAAARALGTTRETLRYRIRKYGLSLNA
jgi:DNA-binding NtrC family response regulator